MTRRKFYLIISLLAFGSGMPLALSSSAIAATTLSESDAQMLARKYYATQGEWAGKFEISRFLKTRFEPEKAKTATVHFQYEWSFLQNPAKTGIDNRYFVYQRVGNGWRVVEMGPHQSGRP